MGEKRSEFRFVVENLQKPSREYNISAGARYGVDPVGIENVVVVTDIGPLGPLGDIPVNGVLVLSATIPPSPSAPYDVPMQALIGHSLSNLSVLEVRDVWSGEGL